MSRILIIDDTRAVHAFVKNLLAKSPGITTVSVFNGREAMELLTSDRTFDLIFLDWEMPILNGPDTFDQMILAKTNIPTIMMTTKNDPENIELMLGKGVAEYLIKPFTLDILFEKMEFACGKSFKYAA